MNIYIQYNFIFKMDIGNLSTPALLFLTVSFTTNLFSIFIAPYQCTLTAYSCGIVLLCSILLTLILIYLITWGINVIHFSGRPLISWGIAILFIYLNLSEFYSLNGNSSKIVEVKKIDYSKIFIDADGNIIPISTTPLSDVNSDDADSRDVPGRYYPGQLGDDDEQDQGSSSYGQAGQDQGSSSYGQAGSSQGSSSGQAGSSQGSSSGQVGSSQGS